MSDVSFSSPDLDSFCRLDTLGLTVVGQQVGADRAVLECRVREPDDWCRRCGAAGSVRDTVVRRLAHVPLGWRPTTLVVRVRRYACTGCGHVWRQNTDMAADSRAKPVNGRRSYPGPFGYHGNRDPDRPLADEFTDRGVDRVQDATGSPTGAPSGACPDT